MRGLTRRQSEIFAFIVETVEEFGYPPTILEICAHFRFSSTNAASDHVAALARKGFLSISSGECRGIRVSGVRWQMVPIAEEST